MKQAHLSHAQNLNVAVDIGKVDVILIDICGPKEEKSHFLAINVVRLSATWIIYENILEQSTQTRNTCAHTQRVTIPAIIFATSIGICSIFFKLT